MSSPSTTSDGSRRIELASGSAPDRAWRVDAVSPEGQAPFLELSSPYEEFPTRRFDRPLRDAVVTVEIGRVPGLAGAPRPGQGWLLVCGWASPAVGRVTVEPGDDSSHGAEPVVVDVVSGLQAFAVAVENARSSGLVVASSMAGEPLAEVSLPSERRSLPSREQTIEELRQALFSGQEEARQARLPVLGEGNHPVPWRVIGDIHDGRLDLRLVAMDEFRNGMGLEHWALAAHEVISRTLVHTWPMDSRPELQTHIALLGQVAKSVPTVVARLEDADDHPAHVLDARNLPVNAFVIFAPLEARIIAVEARDASGNVRAQAPLIDGR